jgi:hypothetical protein
MALQRIGVSTLLTSFSGTDKVTLACVNSWESCRDAVLETWDWKCASARAQLSQQTTTPIFGPTFSYPLPTQPYCLKVREMRPHIASYVIEGRNLLTYVDSTKDPVYIRYTGRVTDPGQLDTLVAKTIAWRIAAEIGNFLIREKGLIKEILGEYELIIEEAQAKNQYSGKDHNEEPGWYNNRSLYDPWGNFAGLDGERLIDNSDNWVNAGTWIMSP